MDGLDELPDGFSRHRVPSHMELAEKLPLDGLWYLLLHTDTAGQASRMANDLEHGAGYGRFLADFRDDLARESEGNRRPKELWAKRISD